MSSEQKQDHLESQRRFSVIGCDVVSPILLTLDFLQSLKYPLNNGNINTKRLAINILKRGREKAVQDPRAVSLRRTLERSKPHITDMIKHINEGLDDRGY
jgi:hypothetical protein